MNFTAVQTLTAQRQYPIQPTLINVRYVTRSLIHAKDTNIWVRCENYVEFYRTL